jgi:hypothetical protein
MKPNIEQAEAIQIDANQRLEEFRRTLTDEAREAMDKMQECVALHEKHGIPIVTFAEYKPSYGFHQWNSFATKDNPNRFDENYHRNAWGAIGRLAVYMAHFISGIYLVRIKFWSKIENRILFDTHPPKDEMDDDKKIS